MREMKDSGVPWIGDIPTMIRLKKLKYLVSFEKGKLPQETNLEGNGSPYIGASEMNGSAPKVFTTSAIPMCREDDILILWDGANAGLVSTNHKGAVSSTVCRVRKQSGDDSRYLYYCLKNAERYYRDKVSGTTIPHMSTDYLDDTFILGFSLIEQRRIADFLDSKCAEIDSILEQTKASIEEYKKLKQSVITETVTKGIRGVRPMKRTESAWFAEIPSTWGFKRLKYLFRIEKRIAGETGHTVLAITQKGVVPKKMDYGNGGQFAEDYSNYQLVYPGDFAMNHMDLLTGWVDISRFAGVTSPDYRVFTLIDQTANHSAYYLYFMQMCYMDKIFYGMGAGVSGMGRWRLQADKFLNFFIPIPPYAEQQEIAAYLDEKCAAIDSLIASKEALIAELETYKKSLIYEYVTGKKEVI